MILRNYFVFDGKSSLDFEVGLSGVGAYDAPQRDYDSIEIPGRNGNLTMDNGRYGNIKVRYNAVVGRNFRKNIDGLRSFLLSRKGYCRLEDTYHPEEFRMGIYAGPFEVDELGFLNRWGETELVFDCKPQRFLKSGERPIVIKPGETVRVLNPTYQPAKPLIKCYATGSFTFGNKTVTVNALTSYIDIDCDLEDATEGTVNRNADVIVAVGQWPVFEPGETGVTNNMAQNIEIIPRWWDL